MRDRQPTNDEIKEYVEQILHGADLEQITMMTVYSQVYSHFPDFDLAQKKDFIKATVKSAINFEPNMAQMEKLVKFLEENPEIATGTNQVNNESLQTTQKWEAVASELNLMGGVNKSSDSWAEFWDVLRSHLYFIIADRNSGTDSRSRVLQQYPPQMMEQMIVLLGGLGNDEIPAESPSTIQAQETAQQTVEIDEDLEPESSGNAPQTEEERRARRKAASSARKAARRSRRAKARALRPRRFTTLERLIRIEEGRLQVNLKSAEILNSYGATAEKLGAFIAACGHKIAGEIERRNTPN